MHLLIQGPPASGKTTLIKEVIPYLVNKKGFYTEEVKDDDCRRVGFKVVTMDKKEVLFAHKSFNTHHRISSYYVDIDLFDSLATKEIEESINSGCGLIIIDEIGKMELLSQRFKEACNRAFELRKVLATIPTMRLEYVENIKERKDVCTLTLDRDNFLDTKDKVIMGINSWGVDKIRKLESKARGLGLEEKILIENASSNLFYTIDSLDLGKKVVVVAGRGNNGADVLSCARKMLSRGYSADIIVLRNKELNRECFFQLSLLERTGANIYSLEEVSSLHILDGLLEKNDFILDGILGIGIRGELDNFLQELIDKLNKSKKIIVSCDIPSGLCPDTGAILGKAIKARFTVTFIASKKGFFLKHGPQNCGKIYVVDIGISKELLR